MLTVLLLAALMHEREREIIDTLVELLIATAHRIKARADRKVTKELINAFKRATGKENILFKVADAALGNPDNPVRAVVFPAVTGGEQTLKDLVHEFKTKGPAYRTTVQRTCPRTSPPAAWRTTLSCANRWTPRSSSPS